METWTWGYHAQGSRKHTETMLWGEAVDGGFEASAASTSFESYAFYNEVYALRQREAYAFSWNYQVLNCGVFKLSLVFCNKKAL